MELDELKNAWQILDRRLAQSNRLNLQRFRDGKLDTLRRRLRPLAWGQTVQMLAGVAIVLLAVASWSAHRDNLPLLIAGIVMHVYGVALIIFGAVTHTRLRRIDYSAAVLDIQKQLADLRRLYVIGGMAVGLCWWLLWVPTLMLAVAAVGGDVYANSPMFVWSSLTGGVLGLLLTAWFHRWSRHPSRLRLANALEDTLTGSSLQNAQKVLDEIRSFETD